MDALLVEATKLAEKCKDSSAVWSDVCDGLRGEGAIDYLFVFFLLFAPPSVTARSAFEDENARARSRQRAGAITFFRLRTDPQSLSSSRICNYRNRHLCERIRSDSREVYLPDVEIQDDKNQSKNGC